MLELEITRVVKKVEWRRKVGASFSWTMRRKRRWRKGVVMRDTFRICTKLSFIRFLLRTKLPPERRILLWATMNERMRWDKKLSHSSNWRWSCILTHRNSLTCRVRSLLVAGSRLRFGVLLCWFPFSSPERMMLKIDAKSPLSSSLPLRRFIHIQVHSLTHTLA